MITEKIYPKVEIFNFTYNFIENKWNIHNSIGYISLMNISISTKTININKSTMQNKQEFLE